MTGVLKKVEGTFKCKRYINGVIDRFSPTMSSGGVTPQKYVRISLMLDMNNIPYIHRVNPSMHQVYAICLSAGLPLQNISGYLWHWAWLMTTSGFTDHATDLSLYATLTL